VIVVVREGLVEVCAAGPGASAAQLYIEGAEAMGSLALQKGTSLSC